MTTEIPEETARPGSGPSDAELISAVREGDSAAFGQLYTRHVDAARRLARTLVRGSSDVDDLVAETFAKLLGKLKDGGGPDASFRAYLLTSLRNTFYDRTRRDRRVEVTDDLTRHDPGVPFVDTAVEGLERSLAARAFARLPERWQMVLWHTEVEGDSPAEVAPLLGLTPNGVSALAYRARERLRQAYLQEHLNDAAGDECSWTIERLGAHVRGGLSSREGGRVEAHLRDCDRCRALYVELGEVNAGFRGILAPLVLGGSAAAYLASGGKGFLAGFGIWGAARQALRTRHGQAAAAGGSVAVVAAVVALALAGGSTSPPPSKPVAQPPASEPAVDPPPAPPAVVPPAVPPADPPVNPPVVPPPGTSAAPVPTTPAVTPVRSAAGLEVAPAGALVRGRPGVLVFTVKNPSGGGGGGSAVAFIGPRLAPAVGAGTGPISAALSFPRGVTLRSATAGDGWTCVSAAAGALCKRATLLAGKTSRAYVAVDVAADAAAGTPTVTISAPNLITRTAPSAAVISSSGLAATMAGTMAANVTVVGNSLLSCPDWAFHCATARAGTGGATDNGNYAMTEYADRKAPTGGPPLGAVSGATLALPGRVLWAGLYWAGTGSRPTTPAAYLRGPASSSYTKVRASRVDTVTATRFSQPAYQASADVTALVRANRDGQWWLAVDRGVFDTGAGKFGGWSLVVLVADGGPARSVAIFDGFTPMQGTESFTAALFGTPGTKAQVGFVGWEGDRGLRGDRLKLGATPLGGTDRDNIAASRTGGTPAGWNTFGVDARVLTGTLPADPKGQTVTANTNGDAWLLGVIALVTPER